MNKNSSTFVEIGSELSAEQLARVSGGGIPFVWPLELARLARQAGHALGDVGHALTHAVSDVGNAVVDTGKKIVNFIGSFF